MKAHGDSPSSLRIESDRARATLVLVHPVPEAKRQIFLDMQRSITRTVEQFPGYRSTQLYPPISKAHNEWVVVVQFDDHTSLRNWMESSERREWETRFKEETGEYKSHAVADGFAPWFLKAVDQSKSPASWKMALVVLLGLYPTVMLLSIFVSPFTSPLGIAASTLIGNAIGVAALQWVVVPALSKMFRPWLFAKRDSTLMSSLAGASIILGTLAALAIAFSLMRN